MLKFYVVIEEKHHDEKPTVMQKVKDKAKKIKNKMGKTKQEDGPNRESDTNLDEEEMEVEEDGYKEDVDPNINSAPSNFFFFYIYLLVFVRCVLI